MIRREIRCKRCGERATISCPDKLTDIGLDIISYCTQCLQVIINKGGHGHE